MRIVLIDSEPPSPYGGGIRTYNRLLLKIFKAYHIPCKIYTHNPEAYFGENVHTIQRKALFKSPIRGIMYRFFSLANILFEHSNWLNDEIKNHDSNDTVYEFPDFLGYGFFAIRNKKVNSRITLRIHTPNFLVPVQQAGFSSSLVKRLNAFREKFCLKYAKHISLPSREFILEKLPSLLNCKYIPNPVPESNFNFNLVPDSDYHDMRFLYLGRIEIRKGVLPMMKAFINFSKANPEATLTLIGSRSSEEYGSQIDAVVNAESMEIKTRIKFEPHHPQLEKLDLFSRFDFLIIPSLWENSPYVYFEGMAAGLVCIGSATGEMKVVAQATHAPIVIPGDEKDWEVILNQIQKLDRKKVLHAQIDYLHDQQKKIPLAIKNYFLEILAK